MLHFLEQIFNHQISFPLTAFPLSALKNPLGRSNCLCQGATEAKKLAKNKLVVFKEQWNMSASRREKDILNKRIQSLDLHLISLICTTVSL